MGGKKGGGGKGKKKELEEKDVLTEVDREYYEIQLVDLNRKLSRLRNRSAELEVANASLEEELRALDEDRADIITYLNKALVVKTEEMAELQERLDGLKQAMETGEVQYKETIKQRELEYKNMHEQLTSEIKLLMGKLNSLEEFRTQRDELLAKFANQEEKMAELEENHQKTLHDADRNLVIEKDKLKMQMESRLVELSKQFQKTTDVRIAATTHRMIRENIAVNTELEIMQQVQKKMLVAFEDMKDKNIQAELQVRLSEEERDQALKKNFNQKKAIEGLKTEKEEMEKLIGDMDLIKQNHQEMKKKYEEMEEALQNAQEEAKEANKRYADGQANAAKLYADVAALKVSGRRLYGLLHKAVTAVQEALHIKQDSEDQEQDLALKTFRRDHLLLNLLELLNRATMAERERFILSRSSTVQNYSKGDLGLLPKIED